MGREEGGSLTISRVFSLKIGVEQSQIVLSRCSNVRLTTNVHLALCRDEFHGPQCDTVMQMVLATTAHDYWLTTLLHTRA
ncbi:hypothetical protein TNCV_2873701 [Trichonephila clavipes]|nr:hypothetical protein TNCV_2873701 [Trichonephila clavipes]